MTQIKSIDKRNIGTLRNEYQAALDAVSKKYGLSAHMGRILFDSNEFRCKLTVTAPDKIYAKLTVLSMYQTKKITAAQLDLYNKCINEFLKKKCNISLGISRLISYL